MSAGMMSSEEDPDEGGLKKAKRVRQRVDAGEPRNSYASIPNFSSRPPGPALYNHNGYAATRMLCDLIGSGLRALPPKEHDVMVVDNGNGAVGPGRLFVNGGGEMYGERSPERCSSGGSSSSHLLRDILQQGRQRGSDGHGPQSPLGGGGGEGPEKADDEDSNESRRMSVSVAAAVSPARSGSSRGTSPERPWPSDEPAPNPLELKRARVETIVSNMLQGPAPRTNGGGPGLQAPVNGCKKRKLYQPQQHERVSANGEAGFEDEEEDLETDPSASPLIKRRAGLLPFRQQLRHMHQQLVALQQQYMEMMDGDSTDEDQVKSRDSSEDMKPAKTEPFVDDDNASMYDDTRRLVIDDRKDITAPKPPQEGRESCIVQPPNVDYEWLAESLKAELSTSLSQVVDAVVSRCVQRKAKSTPIPQDPPKDPTLLSQMLDRKSPRTTGKVIDRGTRVNGLRTSPYPPDLSAPKPPPPPFFFPLKQPSSVAATAAFLYGSPPRPPSLSNPPYGSSTPTPEQTEAMSLVVASKKKRHKVTDTRLQQRGAQLCGAAMRSADSSMDLSPKYQGMDLPPLYSHPPPPPLVPVSLPTTVAIPNPSLNQSELFHPSFGYEHHHRLSQQHFAPLEGPEDDAPLHPLLPFHPRGSPDSLHLSSHVKQDSGDLSDAGDSPATYDSNIAMISFLPASMHTSTLTPMHLRKAKLMFFFARYPSSAVLKMYFPDIRFNKNNTAQLVKWFSNFREFFYIQMEKYARQAITEGVKSADDLKVTPDSELLRVLNLHYNRNNHIPSPEQFRYVVEQTLREFYKALVAGKDSEQSWKKSIYKIIARLDDTVPDYFKSPNFLDTLE
ncbi:homeobox protein prospero [Nephila pilipes]|uniref:Homeobox protein prospero n=2 Tax=Nephilidae TaxID=450948 RepID=A0A8X6U834_NEPPI|nr:homeobox protein prospero [Nephila pilipes]